MLIVYGINVCHYFYILWCHFLKVISTTGEVGEDGENWAIFYIFSSHKFTI